MSPVHFKIDHREGKLKEYLSSVDTSSLQIDFENLAHGDIQILIDDKPCLLFERKCLDDLVASIKDGRYKNQKAVLVASGYTTRQMYYIIEGSYKWSDSGKDMPMIKGSVINTLLRDKIGVFFTRNVQDTGSFLLETFQRVVKDPAKYIGTEEEQQPSSQIVVMTQNDKVTPSICYRNMLCQVPGISLKSAEAITGCYPTLKQFFQVMSSLSADEQKATLSKIKVNGRKLSSKIIENLIQYILTS